MITGMPMHALLISFSQAKGDSHCLQYIEFLVSQQLTIFHLGKGAIALDTVLLHEVKTVKWSMITL